MDVAYHLLSSGSVKDGGGEVSSSVWSPFPGSDPVFGGRGGVIVVEGNSIIVADIGAGVVVVVVCSGVLFGDEARLFSLSA